MIAKISRGIRIVSAVAVCTALVGICLAQSRPNEKTFPIQSFKNQVAPPEDKNANIKYDLDPTAEKFAVWIPKEYKEQPGWGLVVFIGGDGVWDQIPTGWDAVLKQRKLLFVIPQNASNDQTVDRRMGLAVLAAREMMQEHKIDPKRVYAAGISGGARMAGSLGFYQPSLFKGTIQSCGADWTEKVPQQARVTPDDKELGDYGVIPATDAEIAAAKAGVKFVFITGSKDFRHAAIVDIYNGGYKKAGFQAKLIDLPGMQHQTCSARQLTAALDFIEGVAPATATAAVAHADPAAAPWAASDPKKWPQILAYNDGVLTNNNGIGGSSFLMKLPDGNVVVATALHVFGDGVKAEDIDKLVKSWAIYQPGTPKKKVVVKKLAITPDPDNPLDCILVNVSTSHSGFEALLPRFSPPQVGETLWVPGLPEGTKGTQSFFKATVTSWDEDKLEFQYTFDPEIDTNGFSGAPVIDSKGRVVGIHLGHGESGGKKYWYAVDIAAPIKQLTGKK